ncbi:HD domain-containing protein [Actinopolymorpha sp. B11F2]|uniref:HD domain-containing protein n=1 Tax=Actinopolymorpha sp. B11F2 TaxID=3160862 RepID=UPI0032E38105
MRDDPEGASDLAKRLLSPLGDRWRHVQAVAARAAEISHVVGAEDRELLVDAAWLHDLGYAPELRETGCHPIDGARYLEREGWPARLVALVAHHSGARVEADVRGLAEELNPYQLEEGPVMDALVYADMTTGPQGQPLTFSERIGEILSRYPVGSEVNEAITQALPILVVHVARVEARLRAAS